MQIFLASILGVLAYTALWFVGVFVGLVLPVILVSILVVGVYFAPRLIETPQLRPLSLITAASLLAGLLFKLTAFAGIKTLALPIVAALGGGIVTGIIRRHSFVPYANMKSVRYGVLSVLVIGLSMGAALGLYAYYFRIDVGLAALRPATVVEGWALVEQSRGLRWSSVRYEKEHSSLRIAASHFAGSPKTIEGYEREAQTARNAAKPEASMFGTDIAITHTAWAVNDVNGNKRYLFRYDFGHRGKGLPMGAFVEYFWYCEELKANFRASARIEHTPADEYAREIEEMIASLKCPKKPG